MGNDIILNNFNMTDTRLKQSRNILQSIHVLTINGGYAKIIAITSAVNKSIKLSEKMIRCILSHLYRNDDIKQVMYRHTDGYCFGSGFTSQQLADLIGRIKTADTKVEGAKRKAGAVKKIKKEPIVKLVNYWTLDDSYVIQKNIVTGKFGACRKNGSPFIKTESNFFNLLKNYTKLKKIQLFKNLKKEGDK